MRIIWRYSVGNDHAEIRTSGRAETTNQPFINTDSKGGLSTDSGGAGHLGIGASGTHRAEGVPADPITGGILSQLIQQTESQLAKARDCIDWYEREAKEFQDQLDNLKHLQQQLEQQQSEE